MNYDYFITCLSLDVLMYDIFEVREISERLLAIFNACIIVSYCIRNLYVGDYYDVGIYYYLSSYFIEDTLMDILYWNEYTKTKLLGDFIHHSITIYGIYEVMKNEEYLFRKYMMYGLLCEVSTIFLHSGMLSLNYGNDTYYVKINALLFLITFVFFRLIMCTYINYIFIKESYEFMYVISLFCLLQYFYFFKLIKTMREEKLL